MLSATSETTSARFECLPPEVLGSTVRLRYRGAFPGEPWVELVETITLPVDLDSTTARDAEPVLRLLSLAAALSYLKAFIPATIAVPHGLTGRERVFLHELIVNGLGEFAVVNDLPATFSPSIEAPELDADLDAHLDADVEPTPTMTPQAEPASVLVAVGGGKDSIVSIEALRGAGLEAVLFSVNKYAPIERTAKVANLPLVTAGRTLDKQLFALNERGAPNGHVPVTAVNSLVAVLTAMALGLDTVVFSNERSSSYGNVVWHGRTVNHQWSKSIDFERLLRRSLPSAAPSYVSLLRPLSELRIARRFASHSEYHRDFTSCNRAFKLSESERTSWCGDCPKCRFVFLCLAPFMPRDDLLGIFDGRDLLADADQWPGFLELLGAEGLVKPFECVGEPDECRVALSLLREHPDWAAHVFLESDVLRGLDGTPSQQADVFAFDDSQHFLTPGLEAVARAI